MKNRILNNVSEVSLNKAKSLITTPVNRLSTEELGSSMPQDVVTSVKQARLRNGSIETIINVEPVDAEKGSRVYALNTVGEGLTKVGEDSLIPEINQQKIKHIKFKTSKYAGLLTASTELLNDAGEQVVDFVAQLAANETRVIRNKEVFALLNTLSKQPLTDVDSIKTQMNTTLRRVKRKDMNIITNNDGFEYLDGLTDVAGNSLLKESETSNSGFKIFNTDVQVFDNEELPTTEGNIPFIFGDTVEAIALFDRESLEINLSDHSGSDFISFKTKFRIRDYFDVQLVADDLLVFGQILKA